jgi:sulfate permease, SulP family
MNRFIPELWVCYKEGYSKSTILNDIIAGITVGVVALPLALAFGIASIPHHVAQEAGISPPAVGLYTAIVAGFLISLLGGSRVQIGGPTGAFIVIVYGIADQFGYAGLVTANLMAGFIVIAMAFLRFGALIKFIPYPVITGFTSGIAVIIFSSQVGDFLGLRVEKIPADFVEKWVIYAKEFSTINYHSFFIGMVTLLFLIIQRKYFPKLPGAIVAIIFASLIVFIFQFPVETVGSRFGEIPNTLPKPEFPQINTADIKSLFPASLTIALLIAIESLLSAVVADGMTGNRHKSDCELFAQGFANIGNIFFGGIPATGAIARTATNIKAGAKTPISGIVHAVTLIIFMLTLTPFALRIPLSSLAAVLFVVSWDMGGVDHFRSLFRAPKSDIAVLLVTFALTVFIDLTFAVGFGMVMASFLFMKRMVDVSGIVSIKEQLRDEDRIEKDDPLSIDKQIVPSGVEVYEIDGPFFFGVADRLKDTLSIIDKPPKVFILRMRKVPAIDATGLHALEEFCEKCKRQGIILILSGLQRQPLEVIRKTRLDKIVGSANLCSDVQQALDRAKELL